MTTIRNCYTTEICFYPASTVQETFLQAQVWDVFWPCLRRTQHLRTFKTCRCLFFFPFCDVIQHQNTPGSKKYFTTNVCKKALFTPVVIGPVKLWLGPAAEPASPLGPRSGLVNISIGPGLDSFENIFEGTSAPLAENGAMTVTRGWDWGWRRWGRYGRGCLSWNKHSRGQNSCIQGAESSVSPSTCA